MTASALAACGSSSSNLSTPAATSTGNSSTTSSVTSTDSLTTAGLAAKLKTGALSVTSAHVTLSIKVGNKSVLNAQGDQTLADGKLTAMNLIEDVGSLKLTIRIVDGAAYVKLPSSLNKSGKPWERATAGSTNPVLTQLSSSLSSVEQSASMSQYGSLAEAASSLKTIGVEQVNSAAATHYSLTVDAANVHSAAITDAMKQALAKTGSTKIPVDMWVDEKGRTVKVSEKLTIGGQAVTTVFSIDKINQPVTITAPPASQVSTS